MPFSTIWRCVVAAATTTAVFARANLRIEAGLAVASFIGGWMNGPFASLSELGNAIFISFSTIVFFLVGVFLWNVLGRPAWLAIEANGARKVAAAATVVGLVLGVAIGLQFSRTVGVSEAAADVSSDAFRSDLLIFLRGRAFPVHNQLRAVVLDRTNQTGISTADKGWLSTVDSDAYQKQQDIQQYAGHPESGDWAFRYEACQFLRRYEDLVQALNSVDERYGYSRRSSSYREWYRSEESLEEAFNVLIAEPRYKDLDECADFSSRREPE